jgi:predicted transcriptional regulator
MTTILTIRLPVELAREFKARTKSAKTTPSAVLRRAAVEYVRRSQPAVSMMREHIDAYAETWAGYCSGEELLRRTRP